MQVHRVFFSCVKNPDSQQENVRKKGSEFRRLCQKNDVLAKCIVMKFPSMYDAIIKQGKTGIGD